MRITWKWLVYIFLAFVGNGMCSTVQTAQQRAFDGAYKNELMVLALAIVSLTLFIIAFFTERKALLSTARVSAPYGVICGAANGAVNLFVMMLVGMMSASLVFPLVSAGGIILTALVSIFYYREKLSKMQIAGLVLGVAAVIFMNL